MDEEIKKYLMVHGIREIEYKIFLLFEQTDLGRELLRVMCESILHEEPIDIKKDSVMWLDGRRSVWRDMKLIITKINHLIEEKKHDRSSTSQ